MFTEQPLDPASFTDARNFAASPLEPPPHPHPSTGKSGVRRWTAHQRIVPATSCEMTLPATQMTKSSPGLLVETNSGGTRESLQPMMVACGCWPFASSARCLSER